MCKHESHAWTNGTVADWSPAQPPRCEPDFISESGSRYVYTSEGVYRHSDHWGRVASCWWTIGGEAGYITGWAFCEWSKFTTLVTIRDRGGYSLAAGETVSVIHSPRDRRGNEHAERIVLTVARATSSFVIDAAGRRFAKSTLRAAVAVKGGAT